jgi:hypothetical protein
VTGAGVLLPSGGLTSDLAAASAQTYVPAVYSAAIHAALGETDEAFHWLERAYE